MVTRSYPTHPMRELLLLLPARSPAADGQIDYAAADPRQLVAIAESAEGTVQIVHLGLFTLGSLLAAASKQAEPAVAADMAEGTGYLIVELTDLATYAAAIAKHCRRETADFNPPGRAAS